jgi:hypothetical protein
VEGVRRGVGRGVGRLTENITVSRGSERCGNTTTVLETNKIPELSQKRMKDFLNDKIRKTRKKLHSIRSQSVAARV